jgi:hypothetical protein
MAALKRLTFEPFKIVVVPLTFLVMQLVNVAMLVFHTGLVLAGVLYYLVGWPGLIALALLIAALFAL